jgi:hypothetical protein
MVIDATGGLPKAKAIPGGELVMTGWWGASWVGPPIRSI